MASPTLKLCLLGAFAAEVDGQPMPPLRFKRSLWLLALLALRQGREVPRTWLAETLWPDSRPESALRNLRQTLTVDLRPTLGTAASLLHSATRTTLCLQTSDVWVDVVAFDAAIASGSIADLHSAVALYRGPLLEGCLEEWALPERAVREEAFYAALERLAQAALAQGEPSAAVGHLRRLIAASPLRESGHAALMESLAACGDAAGVQQVYRDLRVLLHRELNAQPAPATRALYERLQQPAAQPALPQPLRPTAARRLPVPLTRLIGRADDITAVTERFTQGRMVTLVGAGGVGKTRLGIAVAEALAAEYADGVWLVELAALADAGLVASVVAQALSVKEQAGQTILETLTSALSTRSLLLVLDNCEHLLDACAGLIARLLSGCEGLRVLATSRQAMGLFGEWVYRVRSLEVPPLAATGQGVEADKNTVSGLLEYEAVELFVERAAAQSATLLLTASQTLAIAEICGELDGIPLAIEMAAARVRTLSTEEIRSRLSDRFGLLRAGDRTSLPRHQTLQALIDWSYDLLSEAEQALLNRLAVFAGGWTLEAAERVVSGQWSVVGDMGPVTGLPTTAPNRQPPTTEVLDLLTSLVDKSLVVYEEWEGQGRYRMLETVRQYARDRLVEGGESDLVRGRHRDYFLALAEEADPKLRGAEQGEWLHRLESQHENLRVALDWSLSQMGSAAGLRLCGALSGFWETRGHLSEGREWCVRALGTAGGQEQTPERAKALNGAGCLAQLQGDYASAGAYHEESLRIYRGIGDRGGIADSLGRLGNVAYSLGDYASARIYYEESLAISQKIGDRHGIAYCLEAFARLAVKESRSEQAAALWGAAESLREEIGAPLPPKEREAYDRDVADVSHALGEEAFSTAWAKGRAMTLEQAMAHALDESPE